MMNVARQETQETSRERRARRAANFGHVEHLLPMRWGFSQWNLLDRISSILGPYNPLAAPASPKENTVWLFDNIAYRPVHPYPHKPQPFQAEFVAALFVKGSGKELSRAVAAIADRLGIDGKLGESENKAVRATIAQRVAPFLDTIAPARSVTVRIPTPTGSSMSAQLPPSDQSGVCSHQTVITDGKAVQDGLIVQPVIKDWNPPVSANMIFVEPEGWLVISDIDDSIKYTMTPDPIGLLQTTFVDTPQPIKGMPELYKRIESTLNPRWIYLSASPYNLYPFLRSFLHTYYTPGSLILRENSWMDIGGLLKSFTQATQAYKVDRIRKIHGWLPKRKVICVGDSTQSDPEAYGQIYRQWPDWIQAIFIRKVTYVEHMEEKNSDERFTKAFEGVPEHVWKVFDTPEELDSLVDALKEK